MSPDHNICVVIAAYRAEATIARAVRSALAEPEVAEVIVVDDCSPDDTNKCALDADDGSGRLKLCRLEQNSGPAHARNVAIEASRSPLISILDADDRFVPGRFRALLDCEEAWDLIADNIVFIDDETAGCFRPDAPQAAWQTRNLDLTEFIEGNISRSGKRRGEFGFLKPVIRRSFLKQHGLRYNEALRLGEDYEFYVRALALGARYKIVNSCGYVAVVRGQSLSGSHRTDDLRCLYDADRAILAADAMGSAQRAALRRHARHAWAKYQLRNFLDVKNGSGLRAAALYVARHPDALPAIAFGVARDKANGLSARFAAGRAASDPSQPRYLFPADEWN